MRRPPWPPRPWPGPGWRRSPTRPRRPPGAGGHCRTGRRRLRGAKPATDADATPGQDAELLILLVDPASIGRGHGSRLLNASADTLRDNGFTVLRAWVPEPDTDRQRFLAGAGFTADGAARVLDASGDGTATVRECAGPRRSTGDVGRRPPGRPVGRAVLRQGLSVGAATGLYGISFGALSVAAGVGFWPTIALSLLMFTGGSQFAFVAWSAPAAAGRRGRDVHPAGRAQRAVRHAGRPLARRSRRPPGRRGPADHRRVLRPRQRQPEPVAQRLGFWTTGLAVFAAGT